MRPEDAEAFALEKMREHGLAAAGWRFAWNRRRLAFGVCVERSRTIYLSRPLTELNDEYQVRDTILHEIAHALVGNKHGHDLTWQAVAMSIGSTGEARCSRAVAQVQGRFVYRCLECGTEKRMHRRERRPAACLACCTKHNRGIWSRKYLFTLVSQ